MAANQPTLDDLRALVRGTLSDAEELQVYRWMLTCTDPDLPNVLHNLQFEWEQQQRDAELSAPAQKLGGLFLDLWERQQSFIDAFLPEPVQQSSLAYADTSQPSSQLAEGVELARMDDGGSIVRERDFQVRIFTTPTRRRVAAVVTTDAKGVLPFPNMPISPQGLSRQVGQTYTFTVDEEQGRVTFWYAAADQPATFGPQLPGTYNQLEPWLRRLDEAYDAHISAVRLTPRVLTDYYE